MAEQPENLVSIFGGTEGTRVQATSWHEISSEEALDLSLSPPKSSSSVGGGFRRGLIGVLSYDDAANQFREIQSSRFIRVESSTAETHTLPTKNLDPVELEAAHSDADYLSKVHEIQNQIRMGRYYQLNLLRYFTLQNLRNRSDLLERWHTVGGPYSAWIELPGLSLISFSPEQFVKLSWRQGCPTLSTFPIKGTMARLEEALADHANQTLLSESLKDRAELNMIIDLMRNDLTKVCQSGSVRVESPGKLVSFSNVHHLVGHIQGEMRRGLRLGDLLRAVCPAGSITGAPKIEVMKAIQEFEERPRGFFMGHIFYMDEDTGEFNSSVLIRTVVREGAQKHYEFAAGSGIVIESRAADELKEIEAKCRILTTPLAFEFA